MKDNLRVFRISDYLNNFHYFHLDIIIILQSEFISAI